MTFQTVAQVRFAHVDGAGIVFYPRYFEMLNGAIEDWFASHLGADFRLMHCEWGIGVPTVQLSTEFLAPARLGDKLTISIVPRQVGRTSCAYDAVFAAQDGDRVKASATLVCMDLASMKAVPWPDNIRMRMMDNLVPAD